MVEINEFVFMLIITYIAITSLIMFYVIDEYIDKKHSEELKRKEDLHKMKEDIRLMKRDLNEVKMKQGICTTDAEGHIKFIYR